MADRLLLETGDFLLLETGDHLLLESAAASDSGDLTTTGAGSFSAVGSSVVVPILRETALPVEVLIRQAPDLRETALPLEVLLRQSSDLRLTALPVEVLIRDAGAPADEPASFSGAGAFSAVGAHTARAILAAVGGGTFAAINGTVHLAGVSQSVPEAIEQDGDTLIRVSESFPEAVERDDGTIIAMSEVVVEVIRTFSCVSIPPPNPVPVSVCPPPNLTGTPEEGCAAAADLTHDITGTPCETIDTVG